MKILLDLARADHGHATISGTRYRDMVDPSRRVRVVLEPNAFHPGRSGRNHLRILADGAGIDHRRIDQMLEDVELTHAADNPLAACLLRERAAAGGTVFGSSHLLAEVEHLPPWTPRRHRAMLAQLLAASTPAGGIGATLGAGLGSLLRNTGGAVTTAAQKATGAPMARSAPSPWTLGPTRLGRRAVASSTIGGSPCPK